jgi:hypothetical protein
MATVRVAEAVTVTAGIDGMTTGGWSAHRNTGWRKCRRGWAYRRARKPFNRTAHDSTHRMSRASCCSMAASCRRCSAASRCARRVSAACRAAISSAAVSAPIASAAIAPISQFE